MFKYAIQKYFKIKMINLFNLFIIAFSLNANRYACKNCCKTENNTVIKTEPIAKVFREKPDDPSLSCYQRDDLLWVCFRDCDFRYNGDDSY